MERSVRIWKGHGDCGRVVKSVERSARLSEKLRRCQGGRDVVRGRGRCYVRGWGYCQGVGTLSGGKGLVTIYGDRGGLQNGRGGT